MASQTQYDICKAVYDEELSRCKELVNRGKIFLGICSFFIGGAAYRLVESSMGMPGWISWLFLGAIVAFAVAFLLIVLALGIYSYEGMFDPEEFVDGLGDEPVPDDEFLDDRIVDIAVACSRNTRQNDKRASLLKAALVAMFLGVMLGFTSLFFVYGMKQGITLWS